MSAKTVGVKLGRGAGFLGATLWKGTVLAAEAAGDIGEGFLEGAEAGWEDRCKALDAARAARKAKLLAAVAAAEAAAEAAAPMVAVAG